MLNNGFDSDCQILFGFRFAIWYLVWIKIVIVIWIRNFGFDSNPGSKNYKDLDSKFGIYFESKSNLDLKNYRDLDEEINHYGFGYGKCEFAQL